MYVDGTLESLNNWAPYDYKVPLAATLVCCSLLQLGTELQNSRCNLLLVPTNT